MPGARKANSRLEMRSQERPKNPSSSPSFASSMALRRPPASEPRKVDFWPFSRRRLISYRPPASRGATRKKPEVATMKKCPLRQAKMVIRSPAMANSRP
ncbi:MAG: hypothetical protein AW07_00400 [Candidatus Accumulibacter sp. SK-11]|nr:MAG: hypothetical protein AW07_00400 [Candidatus Accumulibacter sp. SK-11]